MRILVITSAYPSANNPMASIFIKEQADSLKAVEIEVDIFIIKGKLKGIGYLKSMLGFWKSIQKKYDVIHAHYGTVGWFGRMQCQVPLVISFLGDDVLGTPNSKGRTTIFSQLLVYSHKILARLSDRIIVQSQEMKRKLGLPKAILMPYGVDLALFKTIDLKEAQRQLHLDTNKRYILFANNHKIPVKNFALAKEAFGIVKQKIPHSELIVLSNEPRDKVPLYMNACDTLILTSFHEGSPMVIKEAMACNLPIVSVDAGDVKEVIKGTKNCFITSRNPNEIAERIIQVFNSGERSNGREHIGHLEINKVAQHIIKIYKRVCKKS
jgi:glycosyltransferase involved in cell wall biosynthesis